MNSLDLTMINQIEKITIEKRKRNQLYITMDYILSAVSLFDFFSIDTFKILQDSNSLKIQLQLKLHFFLQDTIEI